MGKLRISILTFLWFLTLFGFFLMPAQPVNLPSVKRGELNLKGLEASALSINLDGEWAFYWDEVATEEHLEELLSHEPSHYISVPSYWRVLSNEDSQIQPWGVATYAMKVLFQGPVQGYALRLANITPNAHVFVNGRQVAQMGYVNKDPERSVSGNAIQLIPLEKSLDGVYNIVISISNYHNVSGGLNRSIKLGRYDQMVRERDFLQASEALMLGGLLLMALYQLALFILHPKQLAPLFMAGLCFLAFSFSGFKHQMVMLSIFPSWDGEIRTKFIFISMALAGPMVLAYASSLYPSYFRKQTRLILEGIGVLFALLVLLTPKSFFTQFMVPMEILTGIMALYFFTALLKGWRHDRQSGVIPIFCGLVVLFASIGFSMVDNERTMAIHSPALIFFFFILYQAYLQARIFSRAHRRIDRLSQQKESLEKRNLELFSLSYTDSLTGVCNRRLLDDYLASNWRVNVLSQRALGMILVDVDDFQLYNDYYGHRRGNLCLTKVSNILREHLGELGNPTLARYGGEEFAIVFSDVDDEKLIEAAEHLRVAVEQAGIEHRASPATDMVTVSMGCASLVPTEDQDPEALIDAAGKALSRAKDKGRNCCESHSSSYGPCSWTPRLV
ncbi:MAG: diguanylate cyclase [Spirochaetales bacterium]|nr:diguanylate cyclase [Spirochaetales bacterium]